MCTSLARKTARGAFCLIKKKDRTLELKSVFQELMPGRRKVAVKVVDIFGNDTMTIVEVTVGGNK
jgi:hypothetical protein